MSFISYAQNFEDVMLWRALKHIDQGFYIDVGANDPDLDSVTKAFYEQGWRGINVEPAPQWFERLEKARPRDINLQLALGAEPGFITLYEIPNTGLSTAERKFAERHEAERGYQSRELRVKMDTLSGVCERFHLSPIHFLKVDVEGAETAVFQGTDFGKIRPWVVLVEATLPNSQEESYSDWEPILLNAGYEYVYFDGLNRYYVSGEHENLKAAFKAPPNVFDDFVRSERLEAERRAWEAEASAQQFQQQSSQAEERAMQAEAKAEQAEVKAQQAEASAQQFQQWAGQVEARAQEIETKAQQAEEQAAQAEARAQEAETKTRLAEAATRKARQQANEWRENALALQNSASWKITAPLRALRRIVRRQLTAAEIFAVGIAKLRQFTRARVVSTVKWAGASARTSPNLKRFALWLLRAHPGLQEKLRSIYLRNQHEDQPQPVNLSGTSADSVMPLDLGVSDDQECVMLWPGPRGINVDQRTPLESSFHSYSGKP